MAIEQNNENSKKYFLSADVPVWDTFIWNLKVMEIQFQVNWKFKMFFFVIFVYARKLSENASITWDICSLVDLMSCCWCKHVPYGCCPWSIFKLSCLRTLSYPTVKTN